MTLLFIWKRIGVDFFIQLQELTVTNDQRLNVSQVRLGHVTSVSYMFKIMRQISRRVDQPKKIGIKETV